MKQITHVQLLLLLATITKSTFVNLVTRTIVKMNKKGNPYFEKVFKVRTGNYLAGNDYQNRVNTNLAKEGKETDFVGAKNNVGNHLTKALLYNENTKKYYFQYERFDNSPLETVFHFEGMPIDESKFKNFVVIPKSYENQGLIKSVKVMSVTTTNIHMLTVNGTKYHIVG